MSVSTRACASAWPIAENGAVFVTLCQRAELVMLTPRVSVGDGEESPRSRNASQFVFTAVVELDAGARDEVHHGARYEHVTWRSE